MTAPNRQNSILQQGCGRCANRRGCRRANFCRRLGVNLTTAKSAHRHFANQTRAQRAAAEAPKP